MLGATVLGIGIGTGYWLAAGAGTVAHERAERATGSTESAVVPQSSVAVRGGSSSMRTAVRSAINEAPVHAAPDLASYLDSLEARARAQRQVTALEVEPGIEMIRRYSFEPEEEIEHFTERMQALQHEFAPPEVVRPALEVRVELDRLRADIDHPKDESDKQASIARYMAVTRQLDEASRDEALRRLNEHAAAPATATDPQSERVLWSAIEHARDPADRQVLIASYLDLVHTLPEEQGQARLAELSARFGAQTR